MSSAAPITCRIINGLLTEEEKRKIREGSWREERERERE
jgi:hypothetical protein